MRAVPFLFILLSSLLSSSIGSFAIAEGGALLIAQVASDGTTNTTVNSIGNNFNIINGIEKSNNLFHSFSNFSIPTGGSATFNLVNTPNITTIFSRVTGGNVSNIDGLIRTVNSTNPVSLFLMNPNGIIFGQNAKLDIGGSFIGTTANSIKFADDTQFGIFPNSNTPLLSLSVPIGLQFGTNPTPIQVEGTGHSLTRLNPLNLGNSAINPQSHLKGQQLRVQPGKTLALIGGDINLVGGNLEAKDGRIELGSVGSGTVSLSPVFQGWTFSYDNMQSFRDIRLEKQALVDASGFGRGSIQIQGARVSLIDGSLALIQNLGLQSSGGIKVQASELLELIGVAPNKVAVSSALRNETLAAGSNGDITVKTRQLLLKEGGGINSFTYASGTSGKINLEVADSLKLLGFSPTYGNLSIISSTTYGTGNGNNINISTRELTASNGGTISTVSFGSGHAGNLVIKATDLVELSGFIPRFFIPTSISSASLLAGNTGDVKIDTKRLVVSNGGRIDSSIAASGNGGSLTINATDSIEVKGSASGSRNPSLISSSANILDESLRLQLRLPPAPTGDSGNLTINTGKLTVTDGALVNAQNEGSGNAGTLRINADYIGLNNRGKINASAKSGEGGNLNLQVRDTVLIRRDGQISSEAGGKGNGGNITINAPFIIGLENSDITANAVKGRGGNIEITTQGIFGLAYRSQLTSNSDITANSEFGVNGMVEINNFGVDPSSGLVELPVNLVDSSQQIATGCSNNTGSSFVATGRGGIPQNPNQQVKSDVYDGLHIRTWSDIRDLSTYRKTAEITAQILTPETLIQATSWHRNDQGKIQLVAGKSSMQVQQSLTCAAVSKS